jgi:hypothetical protein
MRNPSKNTVKTTVANVKIKDYIKQYPQSIQGEIK